MSAEMTPRTSTAERVGLTPPMKAMAAGIAVLDTAGLAFLVYVLATHNYLWVDAVLGIVCLIAHLALVRFVWTGAPWAVQFLVLPIVVLLLGETLFGHTVLGDWIKVCSLPVLILSIVIRLVYLRRQRQVQAVG